MNFQNDSAYMLVVEGCVKGKGEDEAWKKEFMANLTKDADENAHKEAMNILAAYLEDAVLLGMYYDAMRFLIKCMIYEDEAFDYEGLYERMEKNTVLCPLLPFAREYAANMRKQNGPAEDDMAAFFLKTKNIFSDDFGRFLYGRMKKCSPSYDMAITQAEVDAIAKSVNKKARPGMFLCLIDYVYAGKTRNVEILWYTLKKYVLPILGTFQYTDKPSNEQAIFRNLVSQYAFYIYNVVYLKYYVAKADGQGENDALDPLLKYWDTEDNKKAIDEMILRFVESCKKVLCEVLSGRTYDGVLKMAEELK